MFILTKIADFWGYKHLSPVLTAYVVVDFLFFSFYGKIVVDRIEWLEKQKEGVKKSSYKKRRRRKKT